MSLNIKNPRVHALAREASARTGLSQTGVIEQALEQLLEGLPPVEGPSRADRVAQVLAAIDAGLSDADRRALLADDLYDESGLPA